MAFIPRATFPTLSSLPRSYFLGHHKSGLTRMKSLLNSIDLIIECRDYRVPLTSRNPLFEASLQGKERMIVYTKRELGGQGDENESIIAQWHAPTPTLFTSTTSKRSIYNLLNHLRKHAQAQWKLVGHRILVVGMPNVGKSTLLNSLRAAGVHKGKAAHTGAQPGVTRKVSSGVKIVPSEDDMEAEMEESESGRSSIKGVGGGVYLLDTPGVFIPYVPDAEAMLKLAVCGCIKDTVLLPIMMADYLLYHINKHNPTLYAEYSAQTNDIVDLLKGIARKTGRLGKGGVEDTEAAALWMIQKWRTGQLGRFLLDEVNPEALESRKQEDGMMAPSISQARKADKELRRQRVRMRGTG